VQLFTSDTNLAQPVGAGGRPGWQPAGTRRCSWLAGWQAQSFDAATNLGRRKHAEQQGRRIRLGCYIRTCGMQIRSLCRLSFSQLSLCLALGCGIALVPGLCSLTGADWETSYGVCLLQGGRHLRVIKPLQPGGCYRLTRVAADSISHVATCLYIHTHARIYGTRGFPTRIVSPVIQLLMRPSPNHW
jgi:hypothetical protein